MKAPELYREIFDVLAAAGIGGLADLREFDSGLRTYAGDRVIESDMCPWVDDIYELLVDNWDALEDTKLPEGFIVSYEYPSDKRTERFWWDSSSDLFSARATYSCLFPGRVIHQSGRFRKKNYGLVDGSRFFWVGLPLDFLVQLFVLRPILEASLGLLVPLRMRIDDGWPGTAASEESVLSGRWSDLHRIGAVTERPDELALEASPLDMATAQMIRSPRLLGVDSELFAKLAQDEEAIFLHDLAVRRLVSLPPSATQDAISEAVESLAESVSKLEAAFEHERTALRHKASGVALGAVATVGSFFLPESWDAARTVLGSASAVQAFGTVAEYRRLGGYRGQTLWHLWRSTRP